MRIAGVSGGRTSALMALHYVPTDTVLCFQNTGKEHSKTLDFLQRLEDDIKRPIVRLEFRAPSRGEQPAHATFEIVPHERLSRKGEPFTDLLLCIKSYRAQQKGLGPVAPWARRRFCTAYLKLRTQQKYIESLGWEDPTIFVGLRADEQPRIAKMRERIEKRDIDEQAPLNEAGVKQGVMKFWGTKPYDLDLPEYLGNCTACFLKDEADLATALLDPETDANWWLDITEDYGEMRSRGRPTYAQVLAEAPMRMRIRQSIALGVTPVVELPKKRHALVLKQEETRWTNGVGSFSCNCEGAETMTGRRTAGGRMSAAPYDKVPEKHPRLAVFVGSTNDDRYMNDPTGNRRYWPVRCELAFKLRELKRDRDLIWAEAVAIYKAAARCLKCQALNVGLENWFTTYAHERCAEHRWWFDAEENEHLEDVNSHRLKAEYADAVREHILRIPATRRPTAYTVYQIATEILHLPAERVSSQAPAIGRALKVLKFTKSRQRENGVQVVYHVLPESLLLGKKVDPPTHLKVVKTEETK